mmetsp:Transcript_17530/g.26166  ORF Transcript_17530/g.26166 Transcript_17530/m.26166 type:complete len:85 (-) Transcript_17530:351-605(-)
MQSKLVPIMCLTLSRKKTPLFCRELRNGIYASGFAKAGVEHGAADTATALLDLICGILTTDGFLLHIQTCLSPYGHRSSPNEMT